MQSTRPIRWLYGLGYLLFGILAFLFFVYMTFPFDTIQTRLVFAVEGATSCQIDVGHQSTRPPLKMTWQQIAVSCPSKKPFLIQSLEARIGLKPLLSHRGEIDFQIQMDENAGQITGTLLAQSTPNGIAFTVKEEGMGVSLSPVGLSGTLTMQGEGNWTGKDVFLGTGSFSFTLTDFKISPQGSPSFGQLAAVTTLAGVPDIAFSTLSGEIAWKEKTLLIKTFDAKGEIVEIAMQDGSLVLHDPISESIVSATLQVVPKGSLLQMIPFFLADYTGREPLIITLNGLLHDPQVLINGKTIPVPL